MANRDKASRRGLMVRSYKESVFTRLDKANKEPIANKEDYRYVILGDEIFPIHIDMIDVYNSSDRKFKRGMKKQYKKMMKKHEKTKDKQDEILKDW